MSHLKLDPEKQTKTWKVRPLHMRVRVKYDVETGLGYVSCHRRNHSLLSLPIKRKPGHELTDQELREIGQDAASRVAA